jgi:hypothetical protein
MPRVSYNVIPRYSPGSPALVDRATALRVASNELDAYQRTVEGAYGEDDRKRALIEGISGIVEERAVYPHHYIATDVMTGEQRDSRKPSAAQLAAVERWKQVYGRDWKWRLAEAWTNAGKGVRYYERALQTLLEHCGRTWLDKVKS